MCFDFCFCFLVGIPVGIESSAAAIKICVITTGIKRYKSIIREKKKKRKKRVFLAKTKLKEYSG